MNSNEITIVSVIIPTYKRSDTLENAIESVLKQTFSQLEVIVVDDNSEGDEFRAATEIFMMKYENNPKVVYLKHAVNKNGSAARNTGIKFSNARYISFLDDDDDFFPTKIEKQVQMLENSSENFGGICCNHNKLFGNYIYKISNIQTVENGNYLSKLLSGESDLAAGSTLMVRKTIFDDIGYFDESFRRHQDWEFLVRFFRKYKMLVLKETLTNVCLEGIRNYPAAKDFHKIKLNFLTKFDEDLSKLPSDELDMIKHKQWSEVFIYYLNEYNFKEAKNIYNIYMKPCKVSVGFFFVLKCIYLVIEKKIYFFQPLKYKIFSLKNLFLGKKAFSNKY